jgi:ferric-dicitrate binding protein FerR (iron transport regulator)
MNTPRYAAAAAKLLAKNLPKPQEGRGDRDGGIAVIERAMQRRVERRRWALVGGSIAAAAAGLLLTAGIRWASRPASAAPGLVAIEVSPAGRGAALHAGSRQEPLPGGAQLGAGQSIETPADGGASLKLSTGTSLDLSGSTSFRVDSQGPVERFALRRGELAAHVAKLGTGQRFIVDTPDAEVEVRGTRFRLRVLEQPQSCGAGTRTRLEVLEGVVEVRSAGVSSMIRAAQQWPADCTDEAAVPTISPKAEPQSRAPGGAPGRAAAERASMLKEQNDLFAEAVAKRREGDTSGALRVYQEVITRFPRSALAENATASRMRLLAASHDPRARDEARAYLARYPHGFAATEAQALIEQ